MLADINPKCKKQEAPYPAYSEFCHEDPDEKPSECKMCPWAVEENPNFKPQKKKFHTTSTSNVKRSGLETEQPELEQLQEIAAPVEEEESLEGMLCDLRKPDCEKPNPRRCPPGSMKKEKSNKNKPEEKKKKQDKPKKSASGTLEDILDRGLLPTETRPIFSLKKSDDKPKEQGPCKIKKFKFPPCKQVKKDEEEKVKEKCPKKKKKRRIRDCPKSNDDGKGEKCQDLEQVIEYRLMANKKEGDKSKCPQVDLTTDQDAIDEDRCKTKRPGTTQICPGSLLKKKKRKDPKNKKEASEIVPPVEPEPEKPQRPQPRLRRI